MSEILSDLNNTNDDYSDILFNRPISSVFSSQVALLIGKHSVLSEVNNAFEVLVAMGVKPIVVADSQHRESLLPAEIYLTQKKAMYYENTDEAIELLEDVSTVLAIFGRELNSAMQLFITKFLKDFNGRFVCDSLTVPGFTNTSASLNTFGLELPFRKYTSSTKNKTEQSTIINKAKVLSEYCSKNGSSAISIGSKQAVAMHKDALDKVAVINTSSTIDINALISIFTALTSHSKDIDSQLWLRIFQAAGYLYRNSYGKDGSAKQLKKFLDNQFF